MKSTNQITNITVNPWIKLFPLIGILSLNAFEESPACLEEMSSVFDDGFLNQLDESYFDGLPFENVDQLNYVEEPVNQKRKRVWEEEESYFFDAASGSSSDDSSRSPKVSAAYDIERMSPSSSPEVKRRRLDTDLPDKPTFSQWEHSDDSWDMLPACEDAPPCCGDDSWAVTPEKDIEVAYTAGQENPIGHILSNGVRTKTTDKSTQYTCRACGKDLKGHQHNPIMHFMLPKHEKCWHKISEDKHLSKSISKALYPPQHMTKTTEKNVYACRKCGQKGSKRKILSHVMGAKCPELRREYSNALAWNGIEDTAAETGPV